MLSPIRHPRSIMRENGDAAGFEYSLAKRFADYLGVELRVEVVDNLPELFRRLDENHTHFAAAGLGLTPELKRQYRHGPVYARTRPIIVYNADTPGRGASATLSDAPFLFAREGPMNRCLRTYRANSRNSSGVRGRTRNPPNY